MANISDEIAKLAELRDRGLLTHEEFEEQKAVLLRGGAPSAPAAKPGKGRNVGLGCGALVILLLVIGVIAGGQGSGGNSSASVDPASPAVAPMAVTANELFRAYQANEARAQQTYGDRPLMVSGTVDGVDLDITDNPVVKLQTDNEFMSAQAKLEDASKSRAKDLDKGQKVKLLCQSVSEVIGTPMLHDCAIQ